MMLFELRKDLENIIIATIAEWENLNHVKADYQFEIHCLELITEDLKALN